MIKRLSQTVIALLAVALVFTPGASASGSTHPAATRQVAMGVSMRPATLANYNAFTSTMGRAPATFSIWSDWAGAANPSAFPTTLVQQLHNAGTVPFIFWQPVGSGRPPGHPTSPPLQEACGTSYDKIIGGDWDTYISGYADAAKTAGGRILIRFAHEMDGNWFPFGYTRCNNSAAKFKAMWKHVVTIFRTRGATNVKFVWSPLSATTAQKALYPGSAWVDYVGFTSFNWATYKNLPWHTMLTGVQRMTAGLLKYAKDKPWILAETGSPATPGSRPSWITAGYPSLYSKVPNIKLVVYFDVDMRALAHHQPNWMLTSSKDIKAYKSVLGNVKFQGTIN